MWAHALRLLSLMYILKWGVYRHGAKIFYTFSSIASSWVKVVSDRGLAIDSLSAAPYAIRIALEHELSKDYTRIAAYEMSNLT